MKVGFPKPTGSRKVARGLKRVARKSKEDAIMKKVRTRDRYCRFPLCGCKKFQLPLHVSHQRHRGMGGNPAGDRTTTASMVLVCSARHRDNVYSIDRGTIRWRQVFKYRGADGPILWEVEIERRWIVVAIEKDLHAYEPGVLTGILKDLGRMET